MTDWCQTLDEFERGYAERSGLSLIELYALGLQGAVCICDDEDCEGWQMTGPRSPIDPNIRSLVREVCRIVIPGDLPEGPLWYVPVGGVGES